MPDPLEYIVTGALTQCDKGGGFMMFTSTHNTNIHIQKKLVAIETDTTPLVNIPSYGMCAVTGAPCSPKPTVWQGAYEYVKVHHVKPLIFGSCHMCAQGGVIKFITSGQVLLADALTPETLAQISEVNTQQNELVEEYEAEKNSVGEAGFWEGFIPVWGSGRDAIHSFQTGHWGMGILHTGFVVLDVFTLGSATVVKGLVKGGVREGVELVGKSLVKKAVAVMAAKKAATELLEKGVGHVAEASIKYLGICIAKACFLAGTPIATKEGLKNIEDFQSGDEVWAYNEETGETALKPVLNIFEREADVIIELTIDGEVIATTPEHPFHANGEWKEAGSLEVGDTIQLFNGKAALVQDVVYRFDKELQAAYTGEDENGIEEDYQLTKVYNIEVAYWSTYFVGRQSLLVHNAVCIKQLMEDAAKGVAHTWEDLKNFVHCFVAGTQIKTLKGDVLIENIAVDDIVLSYSYLEQKVVPRKVLEVSQNFSSKIIEINLGTEQLKCTSNHRIWVDDEQGWIEAGELKVDMKLLGVNGHHKTIKSIEQINLQSPIYNFEVETDHNYFVGDFGVLVHNGPGPKFPTSVYNNQTPRETKIYRYFDPVTKETYYVGKTVQGAEKRASQHTLEKGLQKLLDDGKIKYQVIEEGSWNAFQTAAREQHYIMALESKTQKGMHFWNKINALSKAKFDYFSKFIKCP
jgi:hypothetical protein